jgi:hypothetical protein
MKMKLAFSLALSLILLISVSSTILLIDTPSPVLAENGDGGGHGGDDGGDGGGHGGGGGGGHGGDDDDPDPIVGEPGYDAGDYYYYDDYEYSEDFLRIEVPEGQELGDVQNVRDFNGDIIVTADGYPVLGRQIFYKNGDPVLDYSEYPEGEPIYFTNTKEGWISPPVTYFLELGPGFDSGPGNEWYLYTPPPDYWQDDPTQGSPPPGAIPPSETQDGPTQEIPSPSPMPGPENRDGELSPSEAFRDDTQFGEPQPVMGPTGNPRVSEDGAQILGRVVLDEEGNPVIGPNGKPIIVIPD